MLAAGSSKGLLSPDEIYKPTSSQYSGGDLHIRGQFHLNWILSRWRSKGSELSRNLMNIVESWSVDWQVKRGLSHVAHHSLHHDSPQQREPKQPVRLWCLHDAWLSSQPRGHFRETSPHTSDGYRASFLYIHLQCIPKVMKPPEPLQNAARQRLEVVSEQ